MLDLGRGRGPLQHNFNLTGKFAERWKPRSGFYTKWWKALSVSLRLTERAYCRQCWRLL